VVIIIALLSEGSKQGRLTKDRYNSVLNFKKRPVRQWIRSFFMLMEHFSADITILCWRKKWKLQPRSMGTSKPLPLEKPVLPKQRNIKTSFPVGKEFLPSLST